MDLHRPNFVRDLLAFALNRGGDRSAVYLPDGALSYRDLRDAISRFARRIAKEDSVGEGRSPGCQPTAPRFSTRWGATP